MSHEGADVYKGRVIDYGNREYTVLVGFLHKHDKFLAQCLEWLISWWPSLDPFEPSHACSKKGLSMKGDIIEICLAALRAHEMFKAPLATRLQADGLTFPIVFRYMCDLCGLVQYMDACLLTGVLKKKMVIVWLCSLGNNHSRTLLLRSDGIMIVINRCAWQRFLKCLSFRLLCVQEILSRDSK